MQEPYVEGGDCGMCAQIERQFTRGNRILYKDDLFTVWPSLGALEVGHLLVLPNEHIPSVAYLGAENLKRLDVLIRELAQISQSVTSLPSLIAEHGNASFSVVGGSCVQHAHIHLIPSPHSIDRYYQRYVYQVGCPLDEIELSNLSMLKGSEYLLVGQTESISLRHMIGDSFDQQLIRSVHCELQQHSFSYDWRISPNEAAVIETVEAFRSAVWGLEGNTEAGLTEPQSLFDLGF